MNVVTTHPHPCLALETSGLAWLVLFHPSIRFENYLSYLLDLFIFQRCDEHENQIEHITHIPSRSDCQVL